MDTNDSGFGRASNEYDSFSSEGSGASEELYVKADIPWRGTDPQPSARPAAKVTPLSTRRGARQAEDDLHADGDRPIEDIIIGSSPQARALREEVLSYAQNAAPVLIVGETGVGKELVAKELHRWSDRRDAPFVAVNAGAIPESLAPSELFGHRKGAFTGAYADQIGAIAAADRGVLFLDEIGDMPLDIQAQVLRVLDDGLVTKVGSRTPTAVDFRLVTATNVDLRRGVEEGRFRRDLFHRIEVLVIRVAPLRERGDDVIEIGEAIIKSLPEKTLRTAIITPKAADRLKAYRFPGNVRELRNVLTRAAVRAFGGKILPEHISFSEAQSGAAENEVGYDLTKAQDLMTRFLVMKALLKTDGNVTRAAKLTGRGRSTIQELKKQLGGEHIASEFETVCAQMRALMSE
ncbi:MAG TPA: sigma-54 dependent transcriptional regulator [Parvularculaceae bacterium]|nr:sigma-54-dependent Fis family transcriptional regulator [Caulobacterales bacterium]HOP18934.1 sigma-54 dependent transcriptional regulator [Amphiplicatus sp.]HPE30516.1 sigma-54 dependent transcriptional regulator [Parvularculaceae bacterium]